MTPAKGTAAEVATASSIALVGVGKESAIILTDCFRQFKIQTVALKEHPEQKLRKEKFSGCVVALDDEAERTLKAARHSPSNRHILIYGLAADPLAAMRYSQYGINVMLKEPLERAAALKIVRATYLLALHEYRRYVRIPIATETIVEVDGHKFTALSDEISSGGMSVRSDDLLPGKSIVRVAFALPDVGNVSLMAAICWRRESEHTFGVRFNAEDPQRHKVRKWVEDFLQLE